MNPYKDVEMWKNYGPIIPVKYQSNVMYVEPSAMVRAKVKDQKTNRSEFRATHKDKKYAGKELVENVVFGNCETKI
jgi:hypothetical protein